MGIEILTRLLTTPDFAAVTHDIDKSGGKLVALQDMEQFWIDNRTQKEIHDSARFRVVFQDPKEAMLFKLTWC